MTTSQNKVTTPSESVLILAPHPDDETLGCAGTLLKHRESGHQIHWLIGTRASNSAQQPTQIQEIQKRIGFTSVQQLPIETTQVDQIKGSELVHLLRQQFENIQPTVVYLPFYNDPHTDHQFLFKAAWSALKQFRAPYCRQILAYETPSETEYASPSGPAFQPNYYVDISEQLEKKIALLSSYAAEIGTFPFPRSVESIRALAQYRGSQICRPAAEAFELLREVRS
jgi:LmbE family N-acetylglucosaminyl deacetylase